MAHFDPVEQKPVTGKQATISSASLCDALTIKYTLLMSSEILFHKQNGPKKMKANFEK